MKIKDVVELRSAASKIKQFLDNDKSGEVYTSTELSQLISSDNNKVNATNMYFTEYRLTISGGGGRGRRAYWGHPAAIKKLRQELEKANGQT